MRYAKSVAPVTLGCDACTLLEKYAGWAAVRANKLEEKLNFVSGDRFFACVVTGLCSLLARAAMPFLSPARGPNPPGAGCFPRRGYN